MTADTTALPDPAKNQDRDIAETCAQPDNKNVRMHKGAGRGGITLLMQLKQDYVDAINYTRRSLDAGSGADITGEIMGSIEYVGRPTPRQWAGVRAG